MRCYIPCVLNNRCQIFIFLSLLLLVRVRVPYPRLYFLKKYEVEKKHFFVVMNNIANKLLRLIYSLIHKQQSYDRDYIQRYPRSVVISEVRKC